MKIFAHQQKILDDSPDKCGLWLGTGSGKTALALWLAHGPTLVIAPKTQIQDKSWEREFRKLNPPDVQLTTISKETFRRDWEKLPRYETIIIDEAHTVLGCQPATFQKHYVRYPRTSQLYTATRSYLTRHPPLRLYLLSATPDRSPMAIWGARQILGFNDHFENWREEFYTQVRIGRNDIWMIKNNECAKNALSKYIKECGYVGRLQDWFDVPEQTFKTDFVELTAEQRALKKELKLDYPDPLRLAGKEDQCENGILIGDEYVETRTFKNEKEAKILDYALEFPKLLLFARYTAQLKRYEQTLKEQGYKVLTLTGETKDKGQVIKEANESKACIVLAQSQISAGYELPDYPCTIFASLSGSLVDLIQAQGRTLRVNNLQKRLYIYLVARGGRDEKRYNANVILKQDYHEAIYDQV